MSVCLVSGEMRHAYPKHLLCVACPLVYVFMWRLRFSFPHVGVKRVVLALMDSTREALASRAAYCFCSFGVSSLCHFVTCLLIV